MNEQGDLHEYLKKKGALKPATALRFAMDIARFVLLLEHSFSLTVFVRPNLVWKLVMMDRICCCNAY